MMSIFEKFTIPHGAQLIIEALHDAGFEAYVVGGCVRDSLMGKEPNDWDICTSATPDEVKRIFVNHRIIETGLKHGTITIVSDNDLYEVTTFRTESTYADHRRPDTVQFVKCLHDDLSRRDFTINAMAYDTTLIDLFDGVTDLEHEQIRCVGNANNRFEEDALRMLRAIRFATRFGFTIEPTTDASIHTNYKQLKYISQERITTEFSQILINVDLSTWLKYEYIWFYIMPELKTYQSKGIWQLISSQMCNAKHDLIVRLTILLTYLGRNTAEKVLRRFRYDKPTIHTVAKLTRHTAFRIEEDDVSIRWLLNMLTIEEFYTLIDIRKAYVYDSNVALRRLNNILLRAEYIYQHDCFTLHKLAVNGDDLLNLGLHGGRIGEILFKLLCDVIENQALNNRDTLLTLAKEYDKC